MKIAAALVLCLLVAACQRGAGDSVAPAYRTDLENICDAEARSGALQQDPNQRATHVAMWLGPRVQTDEARKFLAGLGAMPAKDKGDVLRREAARVGLSTCPLAETWK
ncbi:MAG TPA: hypothetical protein VMZ28_16745 [Kofleriaceae bacterium]|nr:hypothetical protein [Kofleriaceae bacterium]